MKSNDDNKVSIPTLMFALLAACVAFQLNASMLSPVLVTIAKELNVTEALVGMSQTAFFTSAALFSLFLPRLSDIKGRRKVLTWMLAGMALGNLLAAVAPNIEVLFLARVIQGLSGPVVPMCLIMLRHEISDVLRLGTLMGVITAVNGGIAGIDAIGGGLLATYFGFRSVFWVIFVVAAISVFLVGKYAPESKPSAETKMDWIGTFFLVLSTAGFLFALNEAGKLNSASFAMIGLYVLIAIVAFLMFLRTERNVSDPLVAIHDLKQRSTWALLLTTTLTMTGIFAIVNGLVMSFSQNSEIGFNLKPDLASLYLLTPYALVGWLIGPFSGRLAPVLGYTRVLHIGLIGSIVAILGIIFLGLSFLALLIVFVVLIGVTYAGTANIMLNSLGVVLSPEHNPGFLPGMNAGAFNLGAGLSFALLPAVQTATSSGKDGYVNGMLLGLGISILALLCSFLIPRPVSAEVSK